MAAGNTWVSSVNWPFLRMAFGSQFLKLRGADGAFQTIDRMDLGIIDDELVDDVFP